MKRLSAKQYATAVLDAYTQAEPSQRPAVIQNFFEVLMRRRAMKFLPRIFSHIQRAEDIEAGVIRVRAWSASEVNTAELTERLRSVVGPVWLETTIDPALIGGLRLQIGDTLIDVTLCNRLKRLQIQLSESA